MMQPLSRVVPTLGGLGSYPSASQASGALWKWSAESPRDQVQTYKWLSRAAASGEATAEKPLSAYVAQMKPEEIQVAELIAQE